MNRSANGSTTQSSSRFRVSVQHLSCPPADVVARCQRRGLHQLPRQRGAGIYLGSQTLWCRYIPCVRLAELPGQPQVWHGCCGCCRWRCGGHYLLHWRPVGPQQGHLQVGLGKGVWFVSGLLLCPSALALDLGLLGARLSECCVGMWSLLVAVVTMAVVTMAGIWV